MCGGKVCGPIMGTSNSTEILAIWSDRYCLVQLASASHKDCHFKFQNQSWDAKVISGQSEDSLNL